MIATQQPVISVVMPVYNAGSYLHDAIQSVLMQSFREFELIVIDDGSTDGSAAVIDAFADNDARVRCIRRENRGLVASLQEGVDAAQGDFIARMDADDITLPDRFARQLSFLKSNSAVVCVGSDFELIDDCSRIITRIRQPRTDADIQRIALQGHTTICHPTAMIRTSALRAAGGYSAECYPAEDLDLWLRLGEIGLLANVDEVLLRYRTLSTSISASKASEQRDAAQRACTLAWQRRGISGEFRATEHWRADSKDRNSQQSYFLKYGWQAFNYGQKSTARAYALKALRNKGLDIGAWKLLLKSSLG